MTQNGECWTLNAILETNLSSIEQERRVVEQEKQDIIAWLSPIDFLQTQSDIFSRHEVGTGQWFLESDEFTQWVAGEYKTLWCPGDRKRNLRQGEEGNLC